MNVMLIEKAYYIIIFFIPGFIINGVIDKINPPKRYQEWIFVLRCFIYSLINLLIINKLYVFVINSKNILLKILFLFISTVCTFIIGLIIAYIKKKDLIGKILSIININTLDPSPTAWDYKFSKGEEGYVIVTLIDNTKVKGWYSSNSMASSDIDNHDIYIETVFYEKKGTGKWIEDIQGDGIYIPASMIKYIEFKKGRKEYEKNNK